VQFIHAGNWLEKTELPGHLAVIGGGYIGLEMARFYRRLGSRVTVIEESAQIVAHEDEDVATALCEFLDAEDVQFRLNTRVQRAESRNRVASLMIERDKKPEKIEASHLFVATGRKPNTDDLGLDTVGVKFSERGIIETDRRLASNVPGIWAAGDVRGGPMFTHTSWDDYRILLSQMAGDGSRTTDRVVPYAVFTDPELGRVGMTENEARRSGKAIEVARFEMNHNGKAREIGETSGFIKVMVEKETRLVLGAAVIAADGAELVHEYVDLMNARKRPDEHDRCRTTGRNRLPRLPSAVAGIAGSPRRDRTTAGGVSVQ
jgi:pyruvate/2-oxoglutarate dehydrogenase complex dihydrolipoamide dehydrogenase (E3) component